MTQAGETDSADRERLYRLPDRGWIGGVCAGVSERLGFDLTAIRIITVILTIGSGGLFILIYAVAWAAMPVYRESEAGAREEGAAGSWGWRRARAGGAHAESRMRQPRSGAVRLGLGVTLLTLGILLAFREWGMWWSDTVIWPIVIAAGGAALILRQIQVSGERSTAASDEVGVAEAAAASAPAGDQRDRGAVDLREMSTEEGGPGRIRNLLRLYRGGFGIALILAATTLFLYANGVFGEVGEAALVVVAITAAAGLILTPFLLATARRAREERLQRIRSEERAEVAAHLHDSVLQTLAMIQRNPGDSAEIATLARRQERELREWLSGRGDDEQSTSLAEVLKRAAAEVFEALSKPVEVVTFGERDCDRRGEALAAAMREAVTNAARFAGGSGSGSAAAPDRYDASGLKSPRPVSVFAELSPDSAAVFVRDRGPGFDPGSIPPDRRGVRESIIGRMERHGGSAKIRSRPGEGTEVELTMEFS